MEVMCEEGVNQYGVPTRIITGVIQLHNVGPDGDTIALEGFTHLIPFAAGHEITIEILPLRPDAPVVDTMLKNRAACFKRNGLLGSGAAGAATDAVSAGVLTAVAATGSAAVGAGAGR